ncbi:hypothetical protein ACTFIU_001660 [Dictyostelium citrinum]
MNGSSPYSSVSPSVSSSWVKSSLSTNSLSSLSNSNAAGNAGGNRSTVRGDSSSNKEQKLLGYLQKQSKSQLPNSNVKIYKKKWFWFESDNGTLFYSATSTGALSSPLTPSSLSENIKAIKITSQTTIEQSISFRLELIIKDKNKVYNLRANDEFTVLNWVNTLNQWKKLNCSLDFTNNNNNNNNNNKQYNSIENPDYLGQLGEVEALLNAMSISTSLNSNTMTTTVKPLINKIQNDSEQLKLVLSQVEQQIEFLKSCQFEIISHLSNENNNNILPILQQQQQQQQQQQPSQTISSKRTISNDNLVGSNNSNNNNNNQLSLSVGLPINLMNNTTTTTTTHTTIEGENDDDEEDEEINPSSDIFSLLPTHLTLFVFSYLEPKELLILAQVSSQWQKLASDNLLWVRFVSHFITPASIFDKSHNWKSVYLANTVTSSSNYYYLKNQQKGGKEKYMNRAISMYGVTPLTSLSSSKEGWLHKRGDDLLRIWKKRYFVLRDSSLFYFKHQNDNFPCGVILLNHGTKLKRASASTRKNCFKILQSKNSTITIHKKRMPYYLATDKEEDCNDWMILLNSIIKSNTQHQSNYGVITISGTSTSLPNNNNNSNNNNVYINNNNSNNFNNNNSGGNQSYYNLPPLLSKSPSFSNALTSSTGISGSGNNGSTKSRKSHKKSFSSGGGSGSGNNFEQMQQQIQPVHLTPIYPMFGVALSKILENQSLITTQIHLKIPFILYICLNYIIAKGTKEEGIFRVSGSLREVQELQEHFEQGREIDLDQHDIHAISGLVKTFFRKLPHTLVPADLDEYSTSVQLAASQTEDEKIQEFKFIFESISENSFHIFELLLYCLRLIVRNESFNKMTIENLLIVIMPTLKCSPNQGQNFIKGSSSSCQSEKSPMFRSLPKLWRFFID